MKSSIIIFIVLLSGFCGLHRQEVHAQNPGALSQNNVVWHSQSKDAGESMPCGGGDVGLNVWVEDGNVFFYLARSGTFDENNAMLKLGRVRLRIFPNPFDNGKFRQTLNLADGSVYISGKEKDYAVDVHLWVDVFSPVVHLEVNSNKAVRMEIGYENWRYKDHIVKGKENYENSYKFAPQGVVKVFKDEVDFKNDGVLFYHRNKPNTIFDVTVHQQKLDGVKPQLFNPLKDLTFGGFMHGNNFSAAGTYHGTYLHTPYRGWKLESERPARSFDLSITLSTTRAKPLKAWKMGILKKAEVSDVEESWDRTKEWWRQYWSRSFIFIESDEQNKQAVAWQTGRNYQLFRYMLGCNAYGRYPTKFNGGLFTYDPICVDSTKPFTPDFRRWGGGTFTQQNQRLVYYPMLKSGDFDMMSAAFDFYLRILKNAELRSEVYWGHQGACFTEQLENFGLPNCSEYGWERPADYDPGMQYNAWLEYQWDTALEFCHMMLKMHQYSGADISKYIPFIESCLTFFNAHYQYLAEKRGRKTFDGDGDLVLYPGSSAETYKMAYNATTTVVALRSVLKELLALPDSYLTEEEKEKWETMLDRIPPLSFRYFNGHKTIAPAELWQRINNTETPQLYPVFPWHVYGIDRPGLQVALNTWKYDTDAINHRGYVGWKQDNIFAACLGLTEEAAKLTFLKLKDSGRRFPAFWGPGFDWVPDHNWGGSGMIGLQAMLLQSKGKKIYLFPAWPKDIDVHFKLHAPFETTVEATLKNGKIESLTVIPEHRKKDVRLMFK